MTVREIRAVARLVGRRTTLRYLALGAGAALLSACTGKDEPAASASPSSPASPAPPSAPGSPSAPTPAPSSAAASPTPAATGVVGRAFAEFVKGAWTIRSTLPGGGIGGRKDTGRASVREDGTWTIVWSGIAGTWTGRWSLRGGRLDLQVLTGPKELTAPDISTSVAEKVPETVKDNLGIMLPWYPMGAQDVFGRLEVAYNGTDLRIRHFDMSGAMSIHMCHRA
ncbi:hypothetical protein ACFV7Q_08565 [Streptomyces sp. NPDC059851]|uniref:hypothetical protein n=1 Tax=Streptomyces sp. NPDC059851 TaxID=3346971 RepID=UPI003667727E